MDYRKVHLIKVVDGNRSLCDRVEYDMNFASEENPVTCKVCIRVRDRGTVSFKGESAHQSYLRRRKANGDISIYKCKCSLLFASVRKLEKHDLAPDSCIKCRKESDDYEI